MFPLMFPSLMFLLSLSLSWMEQQHGDRIVLGSCTMVFVFIVPSRCMDIALVDEMITYWDALQEIFTSSSSKGKRRGDSDDLLRGSMDLLTSANLV